MKVSRFWNLEFGFEIEIEIAIEIEIEFQFNGKVSGVGKVLDGAGFYDFPRAEDNFKISEAGAWPISGTPLPYVIPAKVGIKVPVCAPGFRFLPE